MRAVYWWSVTTNMGREFYVKGGSMFAIQAREEAEDRLRVGEEITSWQRKGEIQRSGT